jgi:hypothetical protein
MVKVGGFRCLLADTSGTQPRILIGPATAGATATALATLSLPACHPLTD